MSSCISVAVGVVQHPISHKYLISQRTKQQHLAGFWEFPGGKIEQDESAYQALCRELIEEVNISVESAYLLKQLTHQYDEKSVMLNFFVIKSFQGDAKAMEGQKLEWVSYEELSQYAFPEANTPILKSLALAQYWMITPDCDPNNIDVFIEIIKQSVTRFKLKQVLFRSKEMDDKNYYEVVDKIHNDQVFNQCALILNRQTIDQTQSNKWHLTSKQLYDHSSRPFDEGFLSASCHTEEDLKQAELIGCDCVFLSAVNKTPSHPDSIPLGWSQFKKLANSTKLPVYALGGVAREDLSVSQYQGAIGVAGISTFIERSE